MRRSLLNQDLDMGQEYGGYGDSGVGIGSVLNTGIVLMMGIRIEIGTMLGIGIRMQMGIGIGIMLGIGMGIGEGLLPDTTPCTTIVIMYDCYRLWQGGVYDTTPCTTIVIMYDCYRKGCHGSGEGHRDNDRDRVRDGDGNGNRDWVLSVFDEMGPVHLHLHRR